MAQGTAEDMARRIAQGLAQEPPGGGGGGDAALRASVKLGVDTSDAPPAAAGERDAGSVGKAGWASRQWPGRVRDRDPHRFQVIVRRSVLNAVRQHGHSAPDVEVCGVLVGNVYQDGAAPYLYVESCIRGEQAAGRAAQVTFTADTWNHIQNEMEARHPHERILGWYHTHPGFGIFLSDMDVFIQENFFSQPWQVALVYDPKAREQGLFVWRVGKTAEEEFLVEEDVDDVDPRPEPRSGTTAKAAGHGGASAGAIAELSARLQALERRNRFLVAGIVFLALVALVWPLALYTFLPVFSPPAGGGGSGTPAPKAPAAVPSTNVSRPALPARSPTTARTASGTELPDVEAPASAPPPDYPEPEDVGDDR